MVSFVLFCFLLNGYTLTFSYSENQRCQLTTNLGNISNPVANLQDRVIINCSSMNGNDSTNINVEWKKGRKLLNTSLSIFSKDNVTQQDAGRYECTLVKANQRRESCSVFVRVNAAPQVIHMNYTQVTDEKIAINCFVSGYPKPNFVWYNNGQNRYPYFENKNYIQINPQNYSSKVEKSYPEDGDSYTCEVTNKYGTNNYTIQYFDPEDNKCPEIKDSGEFNVTIDFGKSKSLLCYMMHPSKNHGFYNILPRLDDTNHIYRLFSDGKTRSVNYTIIHAAKSDAGVYTCFYNMTNKRTLCNPSNKTFHVFVREPAMVTVKTKENIYIAIAVSLTGVLVGLGLVMLACYLHMNKSKLQRFYDSVPELRWDVFVSYSSKDFPWVKELCETLEKPPFNLIVCLHQRDWELGRTVIDNMADSVYCSYKTLLIVSKNYLESNYCMQELELAINCESGSRTDHRDKILLIKIDDVSLKKLPKALRQKSYLDFSNSEERKHYKTKLLKALPRRESTDMVDDDSEVVGNFDGDRVVGNVDGEVVGINFDGEVVGINFDSEVVGNFDSEVVGNFDSEVVGNCDSENDVELGPLINV